MTLGDRFATAIGHQDAEALRAILVLGPHEVEQQVYYREDGGRLLYLRVMCWGGSVPGRDRRPVPHGNEPPVSLAHQVASAFFTSARNISTATLAIPAALLLRPPHAELSTSSKVHSSRVL